MPGPISTVSNNTPLILGFGLAVGAVAVGVWGAKGSRGLDGFGRSRRRGLSGRRTVRQLRGATEARDLTLFIKNDGQLYRGQTTSIIKNLATKMAKGVYDRTKAEKLWMYLVESGAKKYAKDSGGDWNVPGQTWHDMFSMEDRRHVAKELNDKFLDEWKEGSYRDMVPKKYQKSA